MAAGQFQASPDNGRGKDDGDVELLHRDTRYAPRTPADKTPDRMTAPTSRNTLSNAAGAAIESLPAKRRTRPATAPDTVGDLLAQADERAGATAQARSTPAAINLAAARKHRLANCRAARAQSVDSRRSSIVRCGAGTVPGRLRPRLFGSAIEDAMRDSVERSGD